MRDARTEQKANPQRERERAGAQKQKQGDHQTQADRGIGILRQRPALTRPVEPQGQGIHPRRRSRDHLPRGAPRGDGLLQLRLDLRIRAFRMAETQLFEPPLRGFARRRADEGVARDPERRHRSHEQEGQLHHVHAVSPSEAIADLVKLRPVIPPWRVRAWSSWRAGISDRSCRAAISSPHAERPRLAHPLRSHR